MTYCLDTNCLIHALKREGTGDQVTSARMFIEQAELRGDSLLIPTVAVAEMLVGCTPTRRAELLGVIEAAFEVADFDLAAAAACADLEVRLLRRVGEPGPQWRQHRYDLMIAATGLAHRADALVTEDRDLRRLLQDVIAVRGFEEPGTLFAVPE